MLNIILRGGRLTKYKGKTASFAPGLGVASPDDATGSVCAPVLGRVASALGTSVSARALATRVMAVAFAAAAPLALTVTGANAGACANLGGGIFVCSGPAAGGDLTQTLNAAPGGALDVSTLPGFGITTAAGDAFDLRNLIGDTDITFTDNNASAITGAQRGIDSINLGTGFTSISTTGAVTGTNSFGVFAQNINLASTSLTINAQGAVQGGTTGIYARNSGTGAVSITTQAVTGTTSNGILARNLNAVSTSLTINAQGAVQGATYGIYARSSGAGAVSITTQAVTGGMARGIFAYNTNGGDLTINAQGAITGAEGIFADQNGSGALSITTQAVTGTTVNGINADNSAAGTSLTINAQGTVTGQNRGIRAINNGSGALSITTQAVTGTAGNGIYARNSNSASLTVNAQGAVTAGVYGIYVGNTGTGALSVTAQTVTGGLVGISARNINAASTSPVTINAQGAVYGGTFGIYASNSGTGPITINNTGGVAGNTGILVGVRANNSPTTINNSAAITGTGPGGVAINFRGNGNDTLNLLPGSAITGTIDFGNGNANDVDTLNVATGVNAVLTFADAGGVGQGDTALLSAPENTSSNVVIVNNGGAIQAVAVDPTGFAASAAAVGGLTTAIFNSIDNTGSGPLGTAPLSGGIAPAGGDVKSLAYGSNRRLWVTGFGGKQKVDGSSSQAGIKDKFGGVITGVESNLGGKGSYGVFGGYARSKIDLEFNAGDVETNSVFGGAYWKMDMGSFRVQLALVAGSADQDTKRNVGGTTARGETDGWFFSPSVTLAAPIEGLSFPLIASGRVSYAALFLDGYTETGGIVPLTVGDRDVQVFSTRAQLTLPQAIANKDGSTTRIDWRAGVDAQFDAGSDNVALTVAGTPLSFSADLDNQVAGFVGSTVTYTSENGLYNLSASGELQSTFDGGYKAVGQVRGAVNF